MTHSHPLAATTSSGFEHDGVPDVVGAGFCLFEVGENAFTSGNGWHAGRLHGGFGRRLVTHRVDHLRARADEFDVVLSTNPREIGVFGQEAVAWVNAVGIGDFRSGNDVGDVEVALGTRRRANADSFIGEPNMKAIAVCG